MQHEKPALTEVKELRRRARENLEDGAITRGYQGDRETAVRLLNTALATELVCVLRYKRHYYLAKGLESESIAAEFLEHANEELAHADLLAQRITELQGEPDFNPASLLSRSHSEYVEGSTLIDMLKEDLVAERIAIDSYGELIRYFGDNDPTSRRVLESILQKEEEHADDLSNLLSRANPKHSGSMTN